ncbi:MAG: DUF2520 domain-containing protein, partial [Proteobacteria bacterium]|nr:DUF2520 domain-containing protein [Pseudomonadota bacterium]
MNRQVPLKYAILGDGKVARHMAHYFRLSDIEFSHWSRSRDSEKLSDKIPGSNLVATVKDADHVLLLISDDSIASFVEHNPCLKNKSLVHFSGTLSLEGVAGCHPLMTFGGDENDLAFYRSIPFVVENGFDFVKTFPLWENPVVSINKSDKAYYHSLCVMAGNFSQILMREVAIQFEQELKIPAAVLFPYLLQNTKNFIKNPHTSVTGPLDRGDRQTIAKHLEA